jgi:Flp pilus assembly protein TadD, contains TPR repeats
LKELEFDSPHDLQGRNSTANMIAEARRFIEIGKNDKALDLLKKVLSIELDNPEVYLLIGKTYEGLGDKKNADRFTHIYETFIV